MTENLSSRLAEAKIQQSNYQPDVEVIRHIGNRTLVKTIGPVGSGKTSVMRMAAEIDAEFSLVHNNTIQEGQSRTEDNVTYLDANEAAFLAFLEAVEDRSLVQYVFHPSTGAVYFTKESGYQTSYCMLAALPSSVEPLERLPFKGHRSIVILPSLDAWESQLEARKHEVTPTKFVARLKEGQQNIEWAQAHAASLQWLENPYGQMEQAAKQMIAMVRGKENGLPWQEGQQRSIDLLKLARQLTDKHEKDPA